MTMGSAFTLTKAILKESLGEKGEQLWLEALALPNHQVPMFIKSQGLEMEICEIAYFEAIQNSLKNQDDFGKLKAHPTGYNLSPEVQWMKIQASAKRLNKTPGLYVFWSKDGKNHDMLLSEKQAGILDKLLDDMLPSLSIEDRKELDYFRELGVVQ